MSDNLIVGLDIGTSKTCAVIAEYNEDGQLEFRGVGTAENTGLRKGVIVNIEATYKSIAKAIEAAELMSAREVKECVVGVAGSHVDGVLSRGVVAVMGKDKEICSTDVSRVIDAARALNIPMDREILHVIPLSFTVDNQSDIRNPINMISVRLEAEVYIMTSSVTTTQNLVRCVNRAGFSFKGCVLQTLASSRAVVSNDEKEIGCILIDIGAEITDFLVFGNGAPYFCGSIPAGSSNITKDLNLILNISQDIAEQIKIDSGACYLPLVEEGEPIVVPGFAGRAPQELPKEKIVKVIQARVEEIFGLIRDKIDEHGYMDKIRGNVVLTGGAALMPGMTDLAAEIFARPARIGKPSSLTGLSDVYMDPAYSTAVGLVLLSSDQISSSISESSNKQVDNLKSKQKAKAKKDDNKVFSKIKSWFKEFF